MRSKQQQEPGEDQAGGAAATPDWSNQGQVVEDAPDRIMRGKTRRRGQNPRNTNSRKKGPGAQGTIVRGGSSRRSPRHLDWSGSNRKDHAREEH